MFIWNKIISVNNTSNSKKMNLLTDDDIKRLQAEILKKESKKKQSVYNTKNQHNGMLY